MQESDTLTVPARIGMVLTEDVFAGNTYKMLAKRGTSLTQPLLQTFTLHGVKYVHAEGEPKKVCLNDDWISSKVTETTAFRKFNKLYEEIKTELEKDFDSLIQDEYVSLKKINK